MSNDEQDKTVFRQPGSGDQTIIRPMPGGSRGAGAGAGAGAGEQMPPPMPPMPEQPAPYGAPPVPPQYGQPQYGRPQQAQPQMQPGFDAQAGYVRATQGLNPLVNAASSLLAAYEKIRQSMTHPNVDGLHQRLVGEIRAFDMRARQIGVMPDQVAASSYVLCVALDEAVVNTPWGAESNWSQKTLLTTFHNETWGGERFYQILDKLRITPMENLYVLELMYLFLSLGFEGKYRVADRGRDTVEQIRDELFSIIRSYRGEYERRLSPNWQGLGKVKKSLVRYVPTWVLASFVAVVLVMVYSGFRYNLNEASMQVVGQLDVISGKQTQEAFLNSQRETTKADDTATESGR